MADWRWSRGNRGWQLEERLAERQELSGGAGPILQPGPYLPRILDRSGGLKRTRHGLRCIDLLRSNFIYNNIRFISPTVEMFNHIGSVMLPNKRKFI